MPFLAIIAPIISLVVGIYSLASGLASGPDEIFFSWVLIAIPAVIILIAIGSFLSFVYEGEEK